MADQKENIDDQTDVEVIPLAQSNRECRDILCWRLYLLCIVTVSLFTSFAYAKSKPNSIFRPIASGVGCGDIYGPASSYPYVYYSNPWILEEQKRRYCVSSCPAVDANGNMPATIKVYPPGTFVKFDITVNSNAKASGDFRKGIDIGYDSIPVLDRICIPSLNLLSNAVKSFQSFQFSQKMQYKKSFEHFGPQFSQHHFYNKHSNFSQGDFQNMESEFNVTDFQGDYQKIFNGGIDDFFGSTSIYLGVQKNYFAIINDNWKQILAVVSLTVIISFLWMFCLRWSAGFIVWCSIISPIIFFAFIGLIFPICLSISGILLIMILFLSNKITLFVTLCKVAGQFIVEVFFIAIIPIIKTFILLFPSIVCLMIMIFFLSAASFHVESSANYVTWFNGYGDLSLIKFYCLLFAALWSYGMIQAITTFVIANACCMWYYSHGPAAKLELSIIRGYKMAFCFHFGSLAFGSLILSIVQSLLLLSQIFKMQAQSNGEVSAEFLEYFRNFLAILVIIVYLANVNAYIQIAMKGKDFWSSFNDGHKIAWSGGIKSVVVILIGQIMMLFGKFTIAWVASVLYLFIQQGLSTVLSWFIVISVTPYLVAMVIMSVYSVTVSTILTCFVVDVGKKKATGKLPQSSHPLLVELINTD